MRQLWLFHLRLIPAIPFFSKARQFSGVLFYCPTERWGAKMPHDTFEYKKQKRLASCGKLCLSVREE
jgi:hypothetical protein